MSDAAKRKRVGRPRILGDRPMTPSERNRRHRAKQRAQRETPEQAGLRRAEEALEALCASRNINSPFDRLLATKAINFLAENKIVEAVRVVDLLPPRITNADTSAPTVTPSSARERLWQLVQANIEADEFVEQREVERLREENAELRRRLTLPPNDQAAKCSSTERVIDPTDIQPPCERGVAPPKYDAPRGAAKALLGDGPIIDAVPVKKAADPGPPPGYDPCVSGLWKGPPAPTAKPVAPPPSSPPPSKNWAARPSEAAWNAWRASGGCTGSAYEPVPGSDGLPVQGWLGKLNGSGGEW